MVFFYSYLTVILVSFIVLIDNTISIKVNKIISFYGRLGIKPQHFV